MWRLFLRQVARLITTKRKNKNMIGVTARYFAVFREQVGQDTETLSTDAATAGELFAEIATRHGFADSMARCKIAINDELAGWEEELTDGDVILFFPPVAGG